MTAAGAPGPGGVGGLAGFGGAGGAGAGGCGVGVGGLLGVGVLAPEVGADGPPCGVVAPDGGCETTAP